MKRVIFFFGGVQQLNVQSTNNLSGIYLNKKHIEAHT